MKQLISILAGVLLCISAFAQPTLKEITITATRTSDYYGEVRLTAILSCKGDGKIGQIQTRIYNRFEEPGRTVNRLVAESINYERFEDGAEILQTFRINNIPDEDSPFVARTVIKAKDGTQSVIETPFSFGTRTEIKDVNGPVPEQTQAK